jgi:hypothetical protein
MTPELLGFWTLSIVQYSKKLEGMMFLKLETPILNTKLCQRETLLPSKG